MPQSDMLFVRVFSELNTSDRARVVCEVYSLFSLISCLAISINLCFRDEFFQIISIFENRFKATIRKN